MPFIAWARRARSLPLMFGGCALALTLLAAPTLTAADVTGPSVPAGADGPAGAQSQGPFGGSMFMPIVLLGGVVLFMLMTSRSQKAEEAKKRAMIDSLKPGQKVVTTFGMVAEIERIGAKGDTVWLLQGEGKSAIAVEYLRSAVANPYDPTPAATAADQNGKAK